MARKRKRRQIRGPARRYRRSPQRYEDVRHVPVGGAAGIAQVTRMGCRDAVSGRKNPYKPAAKGLVSAYREGYRICSLILDGRALPAEEARVARKLDLEMDVRVASRGR